MCEPLTIRLDAETVALLESVKREIDAALPEGMAPPISLAALARHAIREQTKRDSDKMKERLG